MGGFPAMAGVLPPDDAQLLQRVLEDALEKLDLLENMQSLQDNSSTDELSQRIGDEISAVIQEQKDLQRQYGELVDKRSTLTGYANEKKLQATEAQIMEVGESLNQASKTLSRTLISNPNIAENLNKIQKERRNAHTIFTITMGEMSRQGKYETLIHTVEQDKKDREEFAKLKADEKESRETLAKLKADLEEERRLHLQDVNSRKEQIHHGENIPHQGSYSSHQLHREAFPADRAQVSRADQAHGEEGCEGEEGVRCEPRLPPEAHQGAARHGRRVAGTLRRCEGEEGGR